ncbi:hypothetical protein C8R44DRAFT_863435 [Mycena epipterygia]|nr:hypothetical protein C8R44DRAFT_863435 [Mycena epipterygia]
MPSLATRFLMVTNPSEDYHVNHSPLSQRLPECTSDDIKLVLCKQKLMDFAPRHGSNEASSAKLWAVYVAEAEKYDKALVESWRSDMDGLLIFAGLFSASLTAFLIESYKSLTPDITIVLLAQISHQLAASANGTTIVASSPVSFAPTASALICNSLWFISLGLSLSCALVATLLEQWARNFLHRSDMCSAPVIRARIFAFLYYGLKRFNMHTVVEVVPLLLHAALLFFFGGLVAFLAPVNRMIMILSAALLGIFVTGYFTITVLPLMHLDSPYHTPLSGALWRLFAWFRARWTVVSHWTTESSGFHTIVEAISLRAMEPSEARAIRDLRALVWTLKSLADDEELEPLVESIPDLLWGPDGRRYLYDGYIVALVSDPDIQLSVRFEDLLVSCDSGLLLSEAMIRRQIMCFKALWCIASLTDLAAPESLANHWFDLSLTGRVPFSDNAAVNHYAVSTRALTRWSIFCSIRIQVLETLRYIKLCQDAIAAEQTPDIRPALSCINVLQVQESFFVPYWRIEGLDDAKENIPVGSPATSLWLEKVFYCLQSFRHDIPYLIFFDYLEQATSLDGLPYAFDDTRKMFQLPDRPPSTLVRSRLEWIFKDIVNKHLDALRANPAVHWIDEILTVLASFWLSTHDEISTMAIPHAMLQYLIHRNSDVAVSQTLLKTDCNILWSCMSASLTDDAWATWVVPSDSLTALWHLSALTLKSAESFSENTIPRTHVLESTLSCAMAINAPSSSVIALLKATFLNSLTPSQNSGLRMEDKEVYQRLTHNVFPQHTLNDIPADNALWNQEWYTLREILENRTREAYVAVLAEFLESCNSSGFRLSYNAVETISLLDPSWLTRFRRVRIHASVQLSFANGVHCIFQFLREKPEVLETVANLRVFSIIISAENHAESRWLDEPKACEIIRDSLTEYMDAFPSTPGTHSPGFLPRLQKIAEEIAQFRCGT